MSQPKSWLFFKGISVHMPFPRERGIWIYELTYWTDRNDRHFARDNFINIHDAKEFAREQYAQLFKYQEQDMQPIHWKMLGDASLFAEVRHTYRTLQWTITERHIPKPETEKEDGSRRKQPLTARVRRKGERTCFRAAKNVSL